MRFIFLLLLFSFVEGHFEDCNKYRTIIEGALNKSGSSLSVDLICSLMLFESGYDEGAVSKKEAYGLMQVTKYALFDFYKYNDVSFCYSSILKPAANIEVGVWFLNRLFVSFRKKYSRKVALHRALSSYWMGKQKVLDRKFFFSEYSNDIISILENHKLLFFNENHFLFASSYR